MATEMVIDREYRLVRNPEQIVRMAGYHSVDGALYFMELMTNGDYEGEYIAVESSQVVPAAELHDYRCFLCGDRLQESGMGLLHCVSCGVQFLPTCSPDDRPCLEVVSCEGDLEAGES